MAEEQLNRIYFGENGGLKNKNSSEMPQFISSQKQHSDKENAQNPNNKPKSNPQKNNNKSAKNGFLGGGNLLNLLNLKNMKMDNDRLIILAVCLLLSGEDVDELLMLALVYIML